MKFSTSISEIYRVNTTLVNSALGSNHQDKGSWTNNLSVVKVCKRNIHFVARPIINTP